MLPSQTEKGVVLFNRLNIGNIHSLPVVCQAQFTYCLVGPVQGEGAAIEVEEKFKEATFCLDRKKDQPYIRSIQAL